MTPARSWMLRRYAPNVNDFLGGIFALMFLWGLLVYLGPLLVDVLQWFLALIGAY